jgi:hypothetical protein
MSKSSRLRIHAFHAQHGRCIYCDLPMWVESPREINPHTSRGFLKGRRCTAEHLVARTDGGLTNSANIAAACFTCNKRRHARKHPMSPGAYKTHVRRRVEQGKWHPRLPGEAPKRVVRRSPHLS